MGNRFRPKHSRDCDKTKVQLINELMALRQEMAKPEELDADRKRAEEKLRESEVRFRGIFESKMIGTLFWDADGDIIEANDAFLEMVGYTREEVISGVVRWRDMTPPEYKAQDDKALEEVATKGVMTPIEKEYIRKDGSRARLRAERQLLGDCHPEVGAFLMALWGLPESIVIPVACHHEPKRCQNTEQLLPTAIIHVANVFEREIRKEEWHPVGDQLDLGFLRSLDLIERLPAWQELCESFSFEIRKDV